MRVPGESTVVGTSRKRYVGELSLRHWQIKEHRGGSGVVPLLPFLQ